ncbi:unnamed protein product [Auanema sp. JU1783]|nr:unnamed protein product [Auanema sp. JU1783]
MRRYSTYTNPNYEKVTLMDPFSVVNRGDPWVDIFKKCIIPNIPIIFKGFTNEWSALVEWVTEGVPNVDYLLENFGNEDCPVVDAESGDCSSMKFKDYINYHLSHDDHKLYLKDWHFQKKFGTQSYHLPPFLRTDWVNSEHWTNDETNAFRGDYRFLYFGWEGTWTPFHSDVLSSHSWSANICGKKLWYFVPIGKENLFRQGPDFVKDIRDHRSLWVEAGVVEIIQNPGEIVFVPSNWHHQVHNIETSISLNHNSVNATNIFHVFSFLCSREKDVRKEFGAYNLENTFEPEEMTAQVQLVLRADTGLNFENLEKLLEQIISDRSEGENSTCYVCPLHVDLRKCIGNDECMKFFSSNCSCVDDSCSSCSRLLNSYDLSIALQVLSELKLQA